MSRTYALLTFVAIASLGVLSIGYAAHQDEMGPSIFRPDEIDWADGPPSLPKGAKLAVLEGDPNAEGPFVMRIKLPDDYRIAPHTHPKPERVTVLVGTLNLGMGDTFDKSKTLPLTAGVYGTWPPGMKHFAWTSGETIIQVHGQGPWIIEYLNPADDPRNAKR